MSNPASRALAGPSKTCRVVNADHWKPRAWPGRQFWFVIHYGAQPGHHMMRLFEGPVAQEFWLRRNAKWRGALVQSSGKIRWKTPEPWNEFNRVMRQTTLTT